MIIKTVSVGELGTNCYFLIDENSKNAIIIDPGADCELIIKKIENLGVNPKIIVNTHGHSDHIGANQKLKDKYDMEIFIHKNDADCLEKPEENLSLFMGDSVVSDPADRLLGEGDMIQLDGISLEVVHTPGHTKGSISLYADRHLFTGDTLFKQSIGRTDLPGGDIKEIEASLKKLIKYPGETKVYPGHGESSTIKEEINHNPYLKKDSKWF